MRILLNCPEVKMNPYTLQVFIGLCSMMDEYNIVKGKQKDIGKLLGVSHVTISRHIQILRDIDMVKTRILLCCINPEYAIRTDGNFNYIYKIYREGSF